MNQILILSKDRGNTMIGANVQTASYFKMSFDEVIKGRWELVNAIIPNRGYNIQSDNNTIEVIEQGKGVVTITIPKGIYTNTGLVTEIENQLNSNLTYKDYTVTIDGENKVTIGAGVGENFQIDFTQTKGVNSIGTILGYGNIMTGTGINTVKGTSQINVGWNLNWRVLIDEAINGLKIPVEGGSQRYTFSIGIDTSLGGLQVYKPQGQRQIINLREEGTRTITIQIYDDNNNLMEFDPLSNLSFKFQKIKTQI